MEKNSRSRRQVGWLNLFRNLFRKPFRNLFRSLILAALVLLSAACVTMRDPEASQEYRTDVVATLSSGSQAGQSFISRRAGLNGIQLWLRSTPDREIPAQAYLKLELYRGQDDSLPVYSTRISPQRLEAEFPLSVVIPTPPGGPGQDYRVLLQPEGFDLDLFGRNEDAYPYGAFSRDGEVQEAPAAHPQWGMAGTSSS